MPKRPLERNLKCTKGFGVCFHFGTKQESPPWRYSWCVCGFPLKWPLEESRDISQSLENVTPQAGLLLMATCLEGGLCFISPSAGLD